MRHMRCTTTLTRGSVRQAQRKRRRSHSCVAYHHLSSATRWRMARVWRNENRMQETCSEGEPFVPCSFVYFWIPTHSHTFPTEHQLILHRVHGTAIMAYTQFHTPRLPNCGPDSACHPFMYGYRCSTWSSPFAECATNLPLPVYSHTISHLVCRMRGHRRRHGARTCARTTTPDCTILSCESPH